MTTTRTSLPCQCSKQARAGTKRLKIIAHRNGTATEKIFQWQFWFCGPRGQAATKQEKGLEDIKMLWQDNGGKMI
jgi:hypothetical protein